MKLIIHSLTSTVASLKIGNGSVISYHTLWYIWLFIRGWIKVKSCKQNELWEKSTCWRTPNSSWISVVLAETMRQERLILPDYSHNGISVVVHNDVTPTLYHVPRCLQSTRRHTLVGACQECNKVLCFAENFICLCYVLSVSIRWILRTIMHLY